MGSLDNSNYFCITLIDFPQLFCIIIWKGKEILVPLKGHDSKAAQANQTCRK